jgi:MFS transporter, ACDE family, multidrug resistance protein
LRCCWWRPSGCCGWATASRSPAPAAPRPNPLAYLGRFFRQPRLIAGWLFAVMRSCGWWVYVVYLPIFCIEAGLGDKVGGIALSLSNALLFTTPWCCAMRAADLGARVGADRPSACALLFIAASRRCFRRFSPAGGAR